MNENPMQTQQQTPPYYGPQMPQYNNGVPQYQPYLQQIRQAQRQEANPYMMPAAPMIPAGFIKGRPVVSIEEARAAQIDLDGSLHVFTDLGNKKIYTKQINPDGTASLNVYTLEDNHNTAAPVYVTKDELNAVLSKIEGYLKPAAAPDEQPKKEEKPTLFKI